MIFLDNINTFATRGAGSKVLGYLLPLLAGELTSVVALQLEP